MKLYKATMVSNILLVMLFHTSAVAQNKYEKFVDQQLDDLCDYTECFWYSEHLNRFIGSGAEGSSNSHSVTLSEGEEYFIYAVCDQDCSDVDLFIYDMNGALIKSDSSVQAYPNFPTTNAEIAFPATYSGTYRLDVKIHGCTTTSCYYGADIDVAVW